MIPPVLKTGPLTKRPHVHSVRVQLTITYITRPTQDTELIVGGSQPTFISRALTAQRQLALSIRPPQLNSYVSLAECYLPIGISISRRLRSGQDVGSWAWSAIRHHLIKLGLVVFVVSNPTHALASKRDDSLLSLIWKPEND